MKMLFFILFAISSTAIGATTSPEEAYSLASEGKALFVDVREKEEIQQGMIRGAAWFPLSRMKSQESWLTDFLEITKGKKIFLYCRSGNRSGQAQELLKKEGIASENLGGFGDLKEILPVENPL